MPARPILSVLKLFPFVSKISRQLAQPRWSLIKPLIKHHQILDVGLGMGTLAKLMIEDGYEVTGIDVDNTSLHKDIVPIIYDGKKIPFKTNSFSEATIICVLHHCANPQQVLREVMRVSRQAIIIEDTYRNNIEHLLIALRDSLENWEFYRHQYRSFAGWKSLCRENGWQVKHIKSWSSWDFGLLYGHQTCFVVKK